MKQLFSHIADKLLNAFSFLISERSFEQMRTDDWLADVEADHDSWEPDELWAAQHDLTDPATPPAGASVTPAAPASAGGGGHLHPDVERLLANIDRMFQKLNP